MPATSVAAPEPTTAQHVLGMASLSGYCRMRTLTLLNARKGHRAPLPAAIAQLCGDVLPSVGKRKPFEHLYRIAFAFIDIGVPVAKVTQAFREMIEDIEHYAQRRERRQASGILSFMDRWQRINTKGAIEEGEANAACWHVDPSDVASLEAAKRELLDEKATIDAQITLLNEQIAAAQA